MQQDRDMQCTYVHVFPDHIPSTYVVCTKVHVCDNQQICIHLQNNIKTLGHGNKITVFQASGKLFSMWAGGVFFYYCV